MVHQSCIRVNAILIAQTELTAQAEVASNATQLAKLVQDRQLNAKPVHQIYTFTTQNAKSAQLVSSEIQPQENAIQQR